MTAGLPRLLRVAICQINPTVGDIDGNMDLIRRAIQRASDEGAELILLPELAVSGYPPEDLLLQTSFLEANREAVQSLASEIHGTIVVLGFPEAADDVYNSLAVLGDRKIQAIYRKIYLPNYGVFDERRYFQSGTRGGVARIEGPVETRVGLTICEDIWEPGPPATSESLAGAQIVVNCSASPYHAGKGGARESMLIQRARDNLAWVLFCNMVGGQDELVFDGHSVVVDPSGTIVARGSQFAEDLLVCDIDPEDATSARLRNLRHRQAMGRERHEVDDLGSVGPVIGIEPTLPGDSTDPNAAVDMAKNARRGPLRKRLDPTTEIYRALVLGTRDYVVKNGFECVLIGLSGGIDSTLVAMIAKDALGDARTVGAVMPSRYSSPETQADARAVATNLGLGVYELPIEQIQSAFEKTLEAPFRGTTLDATEENLQARIRGSLLMALSNKFGHLVLTTGNKSEYSVGYTTLYGDMAGGYAVIKDVFKTTVYELVRMRNALYPAPAIPSSVVERAPSAELRPDQRDADTLPPYEVLDPVLEAYVERDRGRLQLIRDGFAPELVDRVIELVDRAEYKRRQSPPGIKIGPKAFGRDRRLPITNRFTA